MSDPRCHGLSRGYLLRVVAGGFAAEVEVPGGSSSAPSSRPLLSFSKRRAEVVLLKDGAASHRQTLTEYDPYFLTR